MITSSQTATLSGVDVNGADTLHIDNENFTYRVKAQDLSYGHNETSFSEEVTDGESSGKKFRGVHAIDRDYLMVDFKDGELMIVDNGEIPCAHKTCNDPESDIVVRYDQTLNTVAAQSAASWTITSTDDNNYGNGVKPVSVYRKSKLSGMTQRKWANNDYANYFTVKHHIILKLPSSLEPGSTYTLAIDSATNTDVDTTTFTYDIEAAIKYSNYIFCEYGIFANLTGQWDWDLYQF